jgi:hypothetical protein
VLGEPGTLDQRLDLEQLIEEKIEVAAVEEFGLHQESGVRSRE